MTQSDGELFLIGTDNTGAVYNIFSDDKVEVYSVRTTSLNEIKLHQVASKHMYCEDCNFDAGAGAYVTPSGEVALYGTEHHTSSRFQTEIEEFDSGNCL